MKYKNLLYFLFLLVMLFGISACSDNFQDKNKDDWHNDILLAGDCGEEGLMCCEHKNPACKYGSCCLDPNGSGLDYCSEICEFGKKDTFCRSANECDDGLACVDSYCRICGNEAQPCCDNQSCSGDLACFRGTCVPCGVTGNPCCVTEPYCQKEKSPELDRAECEQEICTLCGASSHPPCHSEPRCNENHLLNNGNCYRCGGFNQPCCQELNPGQGVKKYCIDKDLSCKLDFCSK